MQHDRMLCAAMHLLTILFAVPSVLAADWPIQLNSLGFLPDVPKKASIAAACTEFAVRNATDDKIVFKGSVRGPLHQDDIHQDVWIADFSEVTRTGRYYLDVGGVGRSFDFRIGTDVYADAFYTVMRGFYLWRCGTAVEGVHNGICYAHGACHLDDGWQDYVGTKDTRRDGTGGWHDAGDYGKYTVNAGVTMGALFLAWDHFQDRIKAVDLKLPETATGYPDFLKELKWETDWLLKMQYPDGSGRVSHKLTRLRFSGFIMPETDKEKRYFTEWGSAATADFAAIMAMAARYFKPYDADYAKTCLDAALESYAFLSANPESKRPDLKDFSTGSYRTDDPDDRLWAAAEIWQTTGDPNVLRDFENRAGSFVRLVEANWDWSTVANLGMLTYVTSDRVGRNERLVQDIRSALFETADGIVQKAAEDVYARPMGNRYYWGCNGTVARQTLLLMTAYRLNPKPAYRHASLDAVSHLFGRNYYGRSFVTGLGFLPPLHPHDRRSAADGVDAPWPGYLVGGGETATDWKDEQEDARTNEIAINWQAALVYALASFLPE
jgi:endoglucanase